MKLVEIIKADETLLNWARTSIRYNYYRPHQVANFIDKLVWNKHELAGIVTRTQVRSALIQIDREDHNA